MLSKFEVGDWVWVFDPKIIQRYNNKLLSCWWGQYKFVRKIAPALAEVIAVFEKGMSRAVNLDMLKQFKGENNVHRYPEPVI